MSNFFDNALVVRAASSLNQAKVLVNKLKPDISSIENIFNHYTTTFNHYFTNPVTQLNPDVAINGDPSESLTETQVRVTRQLSAKTSAQVRWQMMQLAHADYWHLITDWALINYCRQQIRHLASKDQATLAPLIKQFYSQLQSQARASGLRLWQTSSEEENEQVKLIQKPYTPCWQEWVAKLQMLDNGQQQTLQHIKSNIEALKNQYLAVNPAFNDVLHSPLQCVNIPSQRLLALYHQSKQLVMHWKNVNIQLQQFDLRNAGFFKRLIITITKKIRDRFTPEKSFTQTEIQRHLLVSNQMLHQLQSQQICMRRSMQQRLTTSLEVCDNTCDDVALQLNAKLQQYYARPFSSIDYQQIGDPSFIQQTIANENGSTLLLEKSRGLNKVCRDAFINIIKQDQQDPVGLIKAPEEWISLAKSDAKLLMIIQDQDLLFAITQLPKRFNADFMSDQLLNMINADGEALWHKRTMELAEQAKQTIQKHITALSKRVIMSKSAKQLKADLTQQQHQLDNKLQFVQTTLTEQLAAGFSHLFKHCLAINGHESLELPDSQLKKILPIIERAQAFSIKQLGMTDLQAKQRLMSHWLMQIIQRLDSLLTDEGVTPQQINHALAAIERAAKTLLSSFNPEQSNLINQFQQAMTSLISFYRGQPVCGVKQFQQQLQPFLIGEKSHLEPHWQKATRFVLLQQSSSTFQSDVMMAFAEQYCPKLMASLYHHDASIRSESVMQLTSQLQAISQHQYIDISEMDLRHVQLVRTYASSSPAIHSQSNTSQPISPDMIKSWQQEWLTIKTHASQLIKKAKLHPEQLSSVIHALPLLMAILEQENTNIDDLAYTRVQQLMNERPFATSLTAIDVRLFDHVHSPTNLQQAIARAVNRHIQLDNHTSITPGLAVLLSLANDTEYLDPLLLSMIEKSLKQAVASPTNGMKSLNKLIQSVNNVLSPYQRVSTNQTIINHLQHRIRHLLSTAIETMQRNESCTLSSCLKLADFSQAISTFCAPSTVKIYRLECYYQWLKQNRFSLSALQTCPYGNTLPALADYFGLDVLKQCLHSGKQALLYDKSDAVFAEYLNGLLASSVSFDDDPSLNDTINQLRQSINDRLKAVSDAQQLVAGFANQPATVLESMKNTFSTIDPTLLSCAYVVSGKLRQCLSQHIKAMTDNPADEERMQLIRTLLSQMSTAIHVITQRVAAYEPVFLPLRLMISNLLLWIEQGRHPIQIQTLFNTLADVKWQFKHLPRCELVRCRKQLAPLWETTGKRLVLDYGFFNRKQIIQQGAALVNLLSRLNALFSGELETQYQTQYQHYQETVANIHPQCNQDDQMILRIHSTWAKIYNRSPFFKLPVQPLALEEFEASALTHDPGNTRSLNLD